MEVNHPTIDLQVFCAYKESPLADRIKQPWTTRGYTYASDGRILIRVPAIEGESIHDHPETSGLPLPVVRDLDPPLMLADIELPAKIKDECEECKEYNQPQHGCPECHGAGWVWRYPWGMDVRGVRLAPLYIELMKTLPNCAFVSLPTELKPVSFIFDGGEGLLMCMRPAK